MGENMGFLIWSLCSLMFITMAIFCFCSKNEKPFAFWANVDVFKVNNIKAYNRALGKLWLAFGISLEFLGIPLLSGQNSPLVIGSVIGTAFSGIILMAVYITVIEPKYRIK